MKQFFTLSNFLEQGDTMCAMELENPNPTVVPARLKRCSAQNSFARVISGGVVMVASATLLQNVLFKGLPRVLSLRIAHGQQEVTRAVTSLPHAAMR